jgi:hypothetical protein
VDAEGTNILERCPRGTNAFRAFSPQIKRQLPHSARWAGLLDFLAFGAQDKNLQTHDLIRLKY